MLETADWIRLSVLMVLGLGAVGIVEWLVSTAVAAIVAFVLHRFVGWSLPLSAQVSIAAIYTLPIFFRILWQNFRIFLFFALIFGAPTFLVSRFVFDSPFIFAVTHIAYMYLFPIAILRILQKTSIIKIPVKETSETSRTYSDYSFKSSAPSSGGSSSPLEPRRNSFNNMRW